MSVNRVASRFFLLVSVLAGFMFPVAAHAALTVKPLSWNVIGLDSNSPPTGPKNFPVGVRVCSDIATTNVAVNYLWDSANPNVNLRTGSPSTLILPSVGAGPGGCSDAYFEVEVNQVPAAFDTTRRYHITANDGTGLVSTTVPRELFVEHLISQSRNSITDLKIGSSIPTLTSIPAGGSTNLVVGNSYFVQLLGGTATQGYNQFEAFINFPNTIFQILSVSTTYSANNSPLVPSPNPSLYADACGWDNDPNSPTYRSCLAGDFKAGGSNVVTTYQIKVLSGGGTSQVLNTLLYDFSGSSYHYNADFSSGARIANVIDPTNVTIAKSFSPNPAQLNGVSALTITLGNPNPGTLGGFNFVDNLPANMQVASTPGITTTGCGTPTLAATSGSSSITFSNGTLAANSTCVIKVNVTPTATGSLVNTTNHLFIDAVDTGKSATDTLTVNNAPPPPPPVCGLVLAQWRFPTGFTITAPAPTVANVTASAAPGSGVVPIQSTNSTFTADGTSSWGGNGSFTTGITLVTANQDYFEFAINTTGFSSVNLTFDALFKTPNGPRGLAVFYGTTQPPPATADPGTVAFNNATAMGAQNTWFQFGGGSSITLSGAGLNPSGTTFVRIYGYNSGNINSGSDLNLDNVSFTGCTIPLPPTLTKSFAPDPVAVGATSTLTFTITNPNPSVAFTGVAFTDTLPSGLTVATTSTPQCGGTLTTTAPSTLSFAGGTLAASGTCTVTATITATTGGAHQNISGFVSSTQGGTNGGASGVASATLTAVLPPSIAKQFSPSPIVIGGTSTLTFTITNPNQNNPLNSVAFNDTLPVAPGAMTVAAAPAASTSGCGAPTFAPAAGAGTLNFSGGTIAPGAICTVSVNVTAPVAGTYNNTSGNVSHLINAVTVNGNTASASLSVTPGSPSVGLLKQVGPTAAGPWSPFLATTAGQNVFYRFTIENTGNVPLTNVSVTDNTLPPASLASCTAPTLPVAVAANDNHILICITGSFTAITGSHTNTAFASANGGAVTSTNEMATYATTGLTLAKSVTQTFYQAPGDMLNYSYLVTNSGFAPLAGPVTVTDDKATVTCPAVTTVGDLDNFFDPGESMTCTATYVITATDISNGSVTNTASASADGVTSPTDSRTVNWRAADLSMTKTLVTAGPYSPGQSITYTLFVANAGPSTATNVQVSDTPTNLVIVNVSGAGCVALPCTIPSIASGANATITVMATITSAGAFDNSATVTATELDPNPPNNTDSTGNGGTAASADVSILKTLTAAGPYIIGQTISYDLLVANAGPSVATSIQVTDTPSNLTIINVSGSGCAALPCTIASLGVGANTTITVTATINAAGAFDNSATATAAESDPNPANNTDSTGNGGTAAASADVSLVKTLTTAGPFTVGQTITYTLFIANAGPSVATSIQVTDTPTNLSITNVSGSGCVALPCTIASLGVGANTTITVTATINTIGAFDNSATATAAELDPNPANNTDNVGNGGTAAASADVSLVKTLTTAGPFTIGQTITYTLFIANAGPSTATSIQVTDTPSNLTITNVSGSGCVALPCTIPSLASGANTTITVTATINAAGAFDNTATATAVELDPNPANNTDSTGNGGTAAASADVSLVKTLTTAGPFTIGQTITYTLFIANAGPSVATSIQVTDTPSNLTITNVSGSGCAALPCTIASLAVGANTTITVTATINAVGAFDNTATATAAELDPNPANNTDSTGNGGTAAASADVSLVKTLTTAGPYTLGQSITYTLVVTNAGPSIATSIQVTDTPTNLTITNVSGSGCAALPCTIASLGVGANTTITVTATINAVGVFDNSATATAVEFDPNPANNTDNTGNGSSTGAAADVSIVKTLTTVGPFTIGQSISYTLLVANAGPSTATSILVTDTPTNLTITNVSGSGCAALPCTIPSLASGANTTINVTATINAAGAFDNTATANGAEFDPNLANNTDNVGNGGTAAASADISVVKTLTTAGPFTVGQTISYTLLIANAGPSVATSIQVTDTPTNLTITNVSGSGCAALPCTIASLAVGANTTITVTATINATGAFDNSATVMAAESDPNLANNTDNVGNGGTAAPSADLGITKTDGSPTYTPGAAISYTITVTNNGPSTVTSLTVTDPVPAAITSPVFTPSTGSYNSGTGAWTGLNLATGQSITLTLSGTVNPAATGNLVNTATVAPPAGTTDSNPANDSATDTDTAAANADLGITKTDGSATYTPGAAISYTITVTNNGPSTVTSLTVTDPVPAAITSPVFTPSTGSYNSGTGAWTGLNLASGQSITLTLNGTVNPAATGNLVNTATVAPPAGTTDSNPANDTATDTDTAAPSADLGITKTDGSPTYTPGAAISYSITVTNNGPSTVTSLTVTDTVPAAITSPVFTPSTGSYNAGTGAWTGLNLASGQNITLTLSGTVNPAATGNLVNTATVAPPAGTTDSNPANDTATDTDTAAPSADLGITKTDGSATYTPGTAISYTITVTNNGPSTVTSLTVTDPVPAAITSPVFTPSTGSYNSGTGAWTGLNLASGQSITLTLSGTVNPAATGNLVNTATVAPPAGTTDSNPANDSATDTDTPAGTSVDLMITKTASTQSVAVGQPFTYTIVVHNNGPATATGVVVSDTLPATFALTSATSTQGSCSGTTTVTCNVGTMLNGATVTITMQGSATSPGVMNNTATVSANETETVTSNNTSSAAPVAAQILAVPTLSELGLVLMALMLAVAGALVMRRS